MAGSGDKPLFQTSIDFGSVGESGFIGIQFLTDEKARQVAVRTGLRNLLGHHLRDNSIGSVQYSVNGVRWDALDVSIVKPAISLDIKRRPSFEFDPFRVGKWTSSVPGVAPSRLTPGYHLRPPQGREIELPRPQIGQA